LDIHLSSSRIAVLACPPNRGNLIEDLPARELKRGEVGTVVEIIAPGVYEIAFSDDDGQTYAQLALITGAPNWRANLPVSRATSPALKKSL
jgi:hypothetical protein